MVVCVQVPYIYSIPNIWILNVILAKSGNNTMRHAAPAMLVNAANNTVTMMICQEEVIKKYLKKMKVNVKVLDQTKLLELQMI